jgi:exonuclease III
MIVLSFNYRGLAHPSKKASLKRLVENISLDILMLQETMGDSGVVSRILGSLLSEWDFYALDAQGRSEGLAIG